MQIRRRSPATFLITSNFGKTFKESIPQVLPVLAAPHLNKETTLQIVFIVGLVWNVLLATSMPSSFNCIGVCSSDGILESLGVVHGVMVTAAIFQLIQTFACLPHV